jgi:hypothetical protein
MRTTESDRIAKEMDLIFRCIAFPPWLENPQKEDVPRYSVLLPLGPIAEYY